MSTIDYTTVKREDLEMQRLPRKSQFTLLHKPSGAVATTPVVPGSHAPARFRRPSNLPKENKVSGMEGYIESTSEDDKQLYVIVAGESSKNEYLDALVGDADAVRISFEGAPSRAATPKADQKTGQQVAPEAAVGASPVVAPVMTPEEALAPVPVGGAPETGGSVDETDLDGILSQLDA